MTIEQLVRTETVIIGAGPAGLAVAACLRQEGVPFVLLERGHSVGHVWNGHYRRLRLHTDRERSSLPHLRLPRSYPKYPSRDQVTAYLELYAAHFGLEPRFGQNVVAAWHEEDGWHTRAEQAEYRSSSLVVATGCNGQPRIPTWPGQESFRGEILHSSAYLDGEPFRGKCVMVVGFGNSGGEIALDLWEHGATVGLSVRNPVNIIPRDLFGIPVLVIAIAASRLPPRLADLLISPVLWAKFRHLSGRGLRRASVGPMVQIQKTGRIPLIDVGTVRLIRHGEITIHPAIERLTPKTIRFTDGTEEPINALILATGYRPALGFLKGAMPNEQTRDGNGEAPEKDGLYFCGFHIAPTGMLREIGIEARQIARLIARRHRATTRQERARR